MLNRMPTRSVRSRARGHPRDIRMAGTRVEAQKAFDFLVAARGARYDKAAERLTGDRERPLTFHDFPAGHRKHIRTANPIESTFATARLRTVRTRGGLGRKTALAMAFRLILSARRKWRKPDGSNQIDEVIRGVPFKDGIKQIKCAARITRHQLSRIAQWTVLSSCLRHAPAGSAVRSTAPPWRG